MVAVVIVPVLILVGFAPGLLGERETSDADVVSITARGLQFEAPREIPQGWTTFQFENKSGMTHFAMIERLPDGVGVEAHQRDVAPIFQKGFELMAAGQADAASNTFDQLPAWFQAVVFLGGPGLVGPGRTTQATVNLDPGTYLIECYVKSNGLFHSYNPLPTKNGMVHQFTVTEETSGGSEPEPSVTLEISKAEGIVRSSDEPIPPGSHTVAVRFRDQAVYENFVGHDVHLARLASEEDEARLDAWMDWTAADGLETPAPVTFLGGTNDMPGGTTGYFTVDLTEGRYAWVAEVPNPSAKGMLKPFTVPAEETVTTRDGNE